MEVEGQPNPNADEAIEEGKGLENELPSEGQPEGQPEGGPLEGEGGEPPAYEPNLTYKVHGEQKEFDDWAKGLVKDPETEQQFREIMEKVHGIDHIKQDREALREQNESLQEIAQRHQNLEFELGTLDQFIKNKNFDAFFEKTQISEQDVLQWAAKRLQYYEMSPEQRAEYDRNVQSQKNEVYFGQQAQTMQDQMHQLKYEQNQFRLDQQLTQPGIAEAVRDYDARVGQPGAFRQAVEERGLFHYHQTGQDVPVEQAVNEVMRIAGMQTQNPAQGPAPQAQQPQAPQAPQNGFQPNPPSAPPQAQKKPVIPKVEGSGASPVKQGVKSIADLKNLAASRS